MRTALFALSTFALALQAQTPLGTVTGLATDPSGAVVANAAVTLSSHETGVKRTATTNASGIYSYLNLPPGTYHLGAEAKGFRPIETRAFEVSPYRTVRQDLAFEVATATSEVVVTDAASTVIQSETPSVGSRLLTKQ